MMRSVSSQSFREKIRTPQRVSQLQNRKISILSRQSNREGLKIRDKQTVNVNRENMLKTPFRETGTTLGRGFSHRIKSSNNFITNQLRIPEPIEFRPNTSQKYAKSKNPLMIYKKVSNSELPHENSEEGQYNPLSKKKYLRKGTAINRGIMLNIMKLKCNGSVFDSTSSYTNYQPNQTLANAIKLQIPRGIRDTVGYQQTLRMSNIFTNGNIKSINMHQKANNLIHHYKKRPQPVSQDEQNTLKSIKRW